MNQLQQSRLNPYSIIWITLIPLKGKATKKDAKLFGIRNADRDEISQHNGNKEYAEARLTAIKGRLSKPYRVYLYTDKQFGMRKYGAPVTSILTTKQANESFIIQ